MFPMMLVLSRACTLAAHATSTHSPSICPSIRRHLLISALLMHLPTVLWAWICAPTTHFFGRTDPYNTVILNSSYGLKVMGTIASQLTPCPKTHLKAA